MPARWFNLPSRLRFSTCSAAVMAPPAGGREKRRGFLRAPAEPNAAVLGTEIGRAMGEGAAAAIARRYAEHDVFRQVLVHRTQPITHPGAQGRMLQFPRVPAGLPRQLRAVIVVNGPEGPHHGQVIRTGADVPEPVAHHQPALAVGFESGLQWHDYLAVSVLGISPDDVLAFGGQHAFVGRLLDRSEEHTSELQ